MNDNVALLLMEMYKKDTDFFNKKVIDSLTELNDDYRLEVFILLSICLRLLSGNEPDLVNDNDIKGAVVKIADRHNIKTADDLKTKINALVNSIKEKRFINLPTIGDVQ